MELAKELDYTSYSDWGCVDKQVIIISWKLQLISEKINYTILFAHNYAVCLQMVYGWAKVKEKT